MLVLPIYTLQKLLQHPELSNSQLLADFLSPHSVESQFLDKMLPDVNLGMTQGLKQDLIDLFIYLLVGWLVSELIMYQKAISAAVQ